MELKPDCTHYRGQKPCEHHCSCGNCVHYEPCSEVSERPEVLIVKTSAMGDVLRTTSLVPPLRDKYPNARITWLTGAQAVPLLLGNPAIDRVVAMGDGALSRLFPCAFELIISLDKTPAECALATVLKSRKKRGIGLSQWGTPVPLNGSAEYYFSLGLCDELKFRKNRKSYPELVLEVCGLAGPAGPPTLHLGVEESARAQSVLSRHAVSGFARVGLVVGTSHAFANKSPAPRKWNDILRALRSALPDDVRLLILGGPDDACKMEAVAGLAGKDAVVVRPTEDVRVFAAILELMDVIVCGDTLALQLALAMARPAVALFGSTCSSEIDTFGCGVKIVSPLDCGPCYRAECTRKPDCMDAISVDRVVDAVRSLLRRRIGVAG